MELLRVSNWSVAARRACQAKPYENVDTFTSSLLKSLFTEKEVKLMKRKVTGAILICLGLGLLSQAVGQTPEALPSTLPRPFEGMYGGSAARPGEHRPKNMRQHLPQLSGELRALSSTTPSEKI